MAMETPKWCSSSQWSGLPMASVPWRMHKRLGLKRIGWEAKALRSWWRHWERRRLGAPVTGFQDLLPIYDTSMMLCVVVCPIIQDGVRCPSVSISPLMFHPFSATPQPEDLRRAQQEADRLREENAQQLTLATRQSEAGNWFHVLPATRLGLKSCHMPTSEVTSYQIYVPSNPFKATSKPLQIISNHFKSKSTQIPSKSKFRGQSAQLQPIQGHFFVGWAIMLVGWPSPGQHEKPQPKPRWPYRLRVFFNPLNAEMYRPFLIWE